MTFTNVIVTFHEKALFHFKLFLIALRRFLRFDIFLFGKYKCKGVPGELGVAKGALRKALESSLGALWDVTSRYRDVKGRYRDVT